MKVSTVFVLIALSILACPAGTRAQDAKLLRVMTVPAPAALPASCSRTAEKSEELLARKLEVVSRWLESAGDSLRGDGAGAGMPAGCAECQVGTISCQKPVSGKLTESDCQLDDNSFLDVWSFSLAAPERVSIALTSAEFDTFLFLTDRNCLVVRQNDDCSEDETGRSCISLELPVGDYSVAVNSLAEAESGGYDLRIQCGGGPLFVRGNTNADATVDLADAVYLLNFLFLGGLPPTCNATADINVDGGRDLTDAVYLLNFLFLGGPTPGLPFPDCDSAAFDVDCESFLPCE